MNEPTGEGTARIREIDGCWNRGYDGTVGRSFVDELLACALSVVSEAEQLRARIAELGKVRNEWGVRWPDDEIDTCDGETEARDRAHNDAGLTLLRRLVGEWRPADDTTATDAEGPTAGTGRTETGMQAARNFQGDSTGVRSVRALSGLCHLRHVHDGLHHVCIRDAGHHGDHRCTEGDWWNTGDGITDYGDQAATGAGDSGQGGGG